LVSGTSKYAYTKAAVQRPPQTKNTLDFRLPLSLPTIYGVMTVMMVFHSQLDEVLRATPRDRTGKGKISPMTIQAPGPQVEAKKKMKKQMKATCALTAGMLFAIATGGGRVIQVGFIEPDGDTNDAHDELTDEHAESAPDEERAAAILLNSIEGDRG